MVSPDADDLALVEACRSGDRNAFKILMQRYQRKVYSVAFGFLRNQEDALDVVQESFIKVHRYLGNFEGNSSFYTWLYRIVTNLCIDHMRKNKRYKALEFDDSLRHDGKGEGAADGETRPLSGLADPAQMLQRREILDAVQDGLQYLSEKHRAVIVMRELEGMSYEEMAKAMGCSKGTIMSRLFHARRNMQRLLTERLGYVPSEVGREDEGMGAAEAVMP
ncbi:MAG TPA: sigma-70 family RNA polymerase sigma factor [Nannocystaceae bacterium]|nr:sigma-70 family RNA polymerase sigma factor [Nannocystaceae bacterium]